MKDVLVALGLGIFLTIAIMIANTAKPPVVKSSFEGPTAVAPVGPTGAVDSNGRIVQ